jgi:sortase (surface protein transpeptidase)
MRIEILASIAAGLISYLLEIVSFISYPKKTSSVHSKKSDQIIGEVKLKKIFNLMNKSTISKNCFIVFDRILVPKIDAKLLLFANQNTSGLPRIPVAACESYQS